MTLQTRSQQKVLNKTFGSKFVGKWDCRKKSKNDFHEVSC